MKSLDQIKHDNLDHQAKECGPALLKFLRNLMTECDTDLKGRTIDPAVLKAAIEINLRRLGLANTKDKE